MKPLVVLTGPTAAGKTSLSIKLAKEINGEIISADSMQVYRGMDIGSAKITPDEMQGVRHHLIDYLDFTEEYNVTRFARDAKSAICDITQRGKVPIIVGGTGFYIQAVLKNVDFTNTDDDLEYRNYLYDLAEKEGANKLHNMLKEVDPVAAEEIHANNIKRVARALEFYKLTGKRISDHNKEEADKDSPYNYSYFVLTMDRDKLYDRIDKRVDIMLDKGLVDEVQALKNKGAHESMVSMQGLGYKEILSYLSGNISLEEAVYIIKRDTRHFAKRQLTWFKREKDVTYLEVDKYSEGEILNLITKDLNQKGII